MATVIIGLGNPVLSDDSVGLRAAAELGRRLEAGGVDAVAMELYGGGLRLMEAMAGYDCAIVIDAMVSGRRAGAIHRYGAREWPRSRSLNGSHDGSLAEALEFGRAVGLRLPTDIRIWAVEAGDVTTIGEELTPAVGQALGEVVEHIWSELP